MAFVASSLHSQAGNQLHHSILSSKTWMLRNRKQIWLKRARGRDAGLLVGEIDESKASVLACLPVVGDVDPGDGAASSKQFLHTCHLRPEAFARH